MQLWHCADETSYVQYFKTIHQNLAAFFIQRKFTLFPQSLRTSYNLHSSFPQMKVITVCIYK